MRERSFAIARARALFFSFSSLSLTHTRAPPSLPPRRSSEDIARIMVSTDNHIGFMERDPVRGSDSFLAFEEVLATARKKGVDMVLLAGDLFHENKPSRYTLWRCV